MNTVNERIKSKDSTSLVVVLSGVILAIIWILIGATSVISPSAGWIFSIVLSAVSWLALVNLNSASKLKPAVWEFLVVAITVQTLAYTLSLVGVSALLTALLAGVVGGGALAVTGLVARQA